MKLYVDTSAAVKMMLVESESADLAAFWRQPGLVLVSTDLLATELRRTAIREDCPQDEAGAILDEIDLYELPRSGYHAAGVMAGATLRSLDALHVTSAIRLRVDGMLVYDVRLVQAAQDHGLHIYAPGT